MSLVPSWSFTSVSEFLQCPKKYQLNRVLKVLPFEESEAMKHGNVVHKQLEDRVRVGAKLPEHIAWLEGLILPMEQKVMRDEWLELGAETEVVLDKNLDMVGLWQQTSPRPWFSKQAWYRGKFDLVAMIDERRAFVGDYKTGKRKPDNTQLELFAAVAFKVRPKLEKVTTAYIWTKEQGAVDQRVFFREAPTNPKEGVSEKGEKEIWAEWLGYVGRIEKAIETNTWPCRPTPLCGWCAATPEQCTFSKK